MKKITPLIAVTVILLAGCSTSTYITGSWKSPSPPSAAYNSLLIAAMTKNTVVRSTLENDMADAIGSGVQTLKSINEFPPDFNGADSNKQVMLDNMKNRNVRGILVISILKKENDSRYIGPEPYTPMGYVYYNNFWSYYSYWYPTVYDPNYYTPDKVYYMETNLYDTQSEKLIWSAQSKTYTPDNLIPFSKEFAQVITGKLRTDGLLPPKAAK
ncbi:MAG: hypothetical protein ACJ77K_00755 [Bacteroidia bacterium]